MGNLQPPPPKKRESKKRDAPPHVLIGKKRKKVHQGPDVANRLPQITPHTSCKLRLLKMDRIKDHLLLEEEFVTNCLRLKSTVEVDEKLAEQRSEVDLIRGKVMRAATLEEMIDDDHAIVHTIIGPTYVPVMSFVDRDALELGCQVLTTYSITAMVGVLSQDKDLELSRLIMNTAPTETYADIGGLESQIEELKEAVELPLTRPDLFEDMGIESPKGVILYGPPGTGKTLMAKAVANKTSARFIRVVGSDLIRKFSGEGPRLVRNIFKIAEEHAPSIIFIDEIDAVGCKRNDSASEGTLEVQRTMLELLTQMDGFDKKSEVKVILATNRIGALDPALIRPGRIDRKIEVSLPSSTTLEHIFRIHSKLMNLADDVNPADYVNGNTGWSGADIKAMCTEAGLIALRDRRTQVTASDFARAQENVVYKKTEDEPAHMYC